MHRSIHTHIYTGKGGGGKGRDRRREERREGAPFSEILPWPNTVYKWSDENNDLL